MSGTPNEAFDAGAAGYDDWYGREPGRSIFAMEVECLRPFLTACRWQLLEIGVGSGRFASALGVGYGMDPALASLRIAASRGVQAVRGIGEKLPFAKRSFGVVLLAPTLCFVGNPLAVLSEARRVLRPEGRLVLGFIPGESPWAENYRRKGDAGHPIYGRARFYSREEVEDLLRGCRFELAAYRSSLFRPPGQDRYSIEARHPGISRRPVSWPSPPDFGASDDHDVDQRVAVRPSFCPGVHRGGSQWPICSFMNTTWSLPRPNAILVPSRRASWSG